MTVTKYLDLKAYAFFSESNFKRLMSYDIMLFIVLPIVCDRQNKQVILIFTYISRIVIGYSVQLQC